MTVQDDPSARRFRMPLEGGDEAFIEYREREDGAIDLLHTFVPTSARNDGVGSRLVREVLEMVRARGGRVVPSCAFVAAFLRQHSGYEDIVA